MLLLPARANAVEVGPSHSRAPLLTCALRIRNEGLVGVPDGHFKFRLQGVYVRDGDEAPCESDVGASKGGVDSWWLGAINRSPINNGLEPFRRRH